MADKNKKGGVRMPSQAWAALKQGTPAIRKMAIEPYAGHFASGPLMKVADEVERTSPAPFL
jgi:hypothetical protein